jgi:hypothetical protein
MALPQYAGWLDNKYTFTVYAIDFLGVQSDTASITVIERGYCVRKAKRKVYVNFGYKLDLYGF